MFKQKDKIGEYTLVKFLGNGSFGEVWKAEKTKVGKSEFALKFLEDKSKIDEAGRELEMWQKVSGLPHIISVIEADKFEDLVFIVSEFADGGSLADYLQKNNGKPKNYQEIVTIISDILIGLEHLHHQNIIHKDLKPDNILIKKGLYCLADFGISRIMSKHGTHTINFFGGGSFPYMPPEAFNFKITPRTDIWAVGIIFYQLLTDELSFSPKISNEDYKKLSPEDQYCLWKELVENENPKPLPSNVPKEFQEIITKALQKDTSKRFQTAKEMRLALEEIGKKLIKQSTLDEVDLDATLEDAKEIEQKNNRLKIEVEQNRLAELERIRIAEEKRLRDAEVERKRIEQQRIVVENIAKERLARETEAKKQAEIARQNAIKAEEAKEFWLSNEASQTEDSGELEAKKEAAAKQQQAEFEKHQREIQARIERERRENRRAKNPLIWVGTAIVLLFGTIIGSGGLFYYFSGSKNISNANKPSNISTNLNSNVANVAVSPTAAPPSTPPTVDSNRAINAVPKPTVEMKTTPTATPKPTIAPPTPETKPTPKVEETPLVISTPRPTPQPTPKPVIVVKPRPTPKPRPSVVKPKVDLDCMITDTCG